MMINHYGETETTAMPNAMNYRFFLTSNLLSRHRHASGCLVMPSQRFRYGAIPIFTNCFFPMVSVRKAALSLFDLLSGVLNFSVSGNASWLKNAANNLYRYPDANFWQGAKKTVATLKNSDN
ncbi:hypothetical protein NY406_05630 [Chlorobaculum sp. MV4-Y]|jgi:hypothetical protein|uniref:hypothetical protein n=1 Tax=Chlorobaculum sp. MV4-Y TaxID=2976335 RepID=UPI0021AF8257|nr:hypothetical protein [Chlorobaculum sp. MV4-Y]UWX56745.1 hypothetical protein NY406_05630 [Chlorobaculum sp. MV4-Y]